ncbi:MAG: hypothetical protein ABIM62_06810 [candidate division WOR-3 bacterium]
MEIKKGVIGYELSLSRIETFSGILFQQFHLPEIKRIKIEFVKYEKD